MTATLDDPFDLEVGPPRDRWSRPLLIPKGKAERVAYTRMSTMAGFICDDFGLSTWTQRQLAVGLGRREDLAALVASLPPLNDAKCDKGSLTKAQREQDAETKKKLDEYIERALEAADRNYKADYGTAVHAFVEQRSADDAPERMKADVQSCLDLLTTRGWEVLASEVFVANDELCAAGSFDHIVRHPTLGPVIADVKTGAVQGKGLQFSIQLAGYANSEVYDWRTDERAPLESLTGGERVNRTVGIVLHVPLGGGRTEPYRIDLRRGQHLARLATHVRQARQIKDLMNPLPEEA